MNHRERRVHDVYEEDPYTTPRAGTFEFVDAVLPWRFEEPLPPPVPPKSDLKARAAPTLPGRVTPWLLRRVKTPVTRATHVTHSQKASTDLKALRSPKPPAYHAVQQPIRPTEERPGTALQSADDIAITVAVRPAVVPVQFAVQVHPLRIPATPPKPAAAHRSAARSETAHRGLTSHSQSSIRSAHEERLRPRTATPPPPRPRAATPLHGRAHLPSYHSAEPFPAPPPYRASAEDSYPTSTRSRSLPRSRKHGSASEKEVPLPLMPSYPPLPSSAVSRIQAGYKVSKEFGDAVMRQEVRVAMPTPEHTRLDHPPTPRVGRRFMSASEMQSFRKTKQHTDKSYPEHEVRLRTSSKPCSHVERSSGDSRQRAASTHSRGRDTKGSNVVREKR